jgi:hypothetical protein
MNTVFHGNEAEAKDLLDAIGRNCECTYDEALQKRTFTCPPHAALMGDQPWLDRLLFERRLRDQLNHEEHDEE